GLGLRPDARAFLDGTRRFAQQITPDPGGSALTSGLGGRPLQARRLHVSSHMGPYTHYPQIRPTNHARSRRLGADVGARRTAPPGSTAPRQLTYGPLYAL